MFAPPPPYRPSHLCTTAVKKDELVRTRSLPCSPSHGAVLAILHCVSTSMRGRTGCMSPGASKLSCHPALMNTGWLNCGSAANTAEEEDEEEGEDDELTPSGCVLAGQRAQR